MRASSDLGRLYDAAHQRLTRLELLFSQVQENRKMSRSIYAAYLTLELDNLVTSFSREFAISVLGGTRDRNGFAISSARTFYDEGMASAYILQVMQPKKWNDKGRPEEIQKRDEPHLRNPDHLLTLMKALQATNVPQVSRAVSLNALIFTQIPTIRNFFAHKNHTTATKVADLAVRLGVPSISRAEELVCARVRSAPSALFEDWTSDARDFIGECTG